MTDFGWYIKMRHVFNFDGKDEYYVKNKGNPIVAFVYDKNGIDGLQSFNQIDTFGKQVKTKHPNIVKTALKTKGSINLHIKMYAEDLTKGLLFLHEIDEWVKDWNAPSWFKEAIIKQSKKVYKTVR